MVILSGLPLIMHMVRAASLSAGSKDSVRERERREKEGKEGEGGERGKREERGRGKKAGSESKKKKTERYTRWEYIGPLGAQSCLSNSIKTSPGTVTMVTQPLKCRAW